MTTRSHSEFQTPGGIYSLTTTIMGWKHVFVKKVYLDFIVESIRFFQNERKAATVGYWIMPNHVHWILKLDEEDHDIVKVLRTMKSYTATQLLKLMEKEVDGESLPIFSIFLGNKHITIEGSRKHLDYFSRLAEKERNQSHRFWQSNSDVKQIDTYKFLRQKLNTIHTNPVNARWELVEDPVEYPYSSCRFYLDGSDWNGLNIQSMI